MPREHLRQEGEQAPSADPPAHTPGAEFAPGADVGALARSDPGTRARAMGALQRGAGNAAISRALRPTLARAISAAQADTIADTVFDAVDGIGTDEDAIYAAMRPVTAPEIPLLTTAYSNRHDQRSFLGDLKDDLSDDDIQENIPALRRTGPDSIAFELVEAMEGAGTDEGRIYRALSGVTDSDIGPIETAYRKRTERSLRGDLEDELTKAEFRRLPVYQAVGMDAVAQQVRDAVEGAGTDENAVYGALAGRTQDEIDTITAAYTRLYGRSMIDDLRDDLSDAEMRRLGALSPSFAPEGGAGEGDAATAVAQQLDDAMSGLGTNEEAIFAALSNRSKTEIEAISAAYETLTERGLEADLRDELSGDDLVRALAQIGVVEAIREEDTELGGLIFGNFDFEYSGAAVTISVRLKFDFRSDVPDAERDPFKTRFLDAVKNTWHSPPFGLHGEGPCPNPDVAITINAVESESDPHKVVDVTNDTRRAHVIDEVNVHKNLSDATIAHEFGHVLGLCDEYHGGWLENLMFWHENRVDDPKSIMNVGTEHRPRYFENIRQRVQAAAPPGCVYHVVRVR